MQEPRYESIPEMTIDEVEAAIERNIPEEVSIAVLSASLHSTDLEWAQGVCLRLSTHRDARVRGNAVLGFGHLARMHRRLDKSKVQAVIAGGLRDPDEFVRRHSHDAADDVNHFLGWSVAPPGETE